MAKFAQCAVVALVVACLLTVAASERAQGEVQGGFAGRNQGVRPLSLDCSTYHECLYFDGAAWNPAVFTTVVDSTTNLAVEWDLYTTADCSDAPQTITASGPVDPGDWAFYVFNDPPWQDGNVVYMSTTVTDLDNGGSCFVGCVSYLIHDFPGSCF
jgi:hypothetical protein